MPGRLRRALDRMAQEGLVNVYARHVRLAAGVRAGVAAIRTPPGLDARDVIRIGYERYNTAFGSGLAQLAGKVFRTGIWAI